MLTDSFVNYRIKTRNLSALLKCKTLLPFLVGILISLPASSETPNEVRKTFDNALSNGASCQELFRIRNTAVPKYPIRYELNEKLKNVGCDYINAEREDHKEDPAKEYASIENSLRKAGFSICDFIPFKESEKHGYSSAREYYIADGACPRSDKSASQNPKYCSLGVGVYDNWEDLTKGYNSKKSYKVIGREQLGYSAIWQHENRIITLPHYTHLDIAKKVKNAFVKSGDFKLLVDRF